MMFYSQCLLDKKGPLGIIWVAAHLEKKLRKNQVTETSIGAAVDTIIYSNVPIALRLSGHLLLGVVRIYSKKVTYLYQDCGETLLRIKRAFNSVYVDLPSDANVAPFHAITLPDNYEFEYMELDTIGYEKIGDLDPHVSTRDQITLNERPHDFTAGAWLKPFDQFHSTKDTTMLNLEEGNQRHTFSLRMYLSNCEITSLEEDVLPPLPLDGPFDFDNMEVETSDSLHSMGYASPSSPSVSTTTVPLCELTVEETSQNIIKEPIDRPDVQECETLRAQQHALWSEPKFMEIDEPDIGKELTDIGGVDKGQRTETKEPFLEEISVPEKGGVGTEMGTCTSPTTPKSISGNDDVLGSILGGVTAAMNIMSAPKTPAAEERRPRSRKRKHIFDLSNFLPDDCMRRQLKYTDDICRIRRKVPCTVMHVWKSYRIRRIEQFLLEPSIPGMSNELQELYRRVVTDQESKSSLYTQQGKRAFEDAPWELKGTSKELQENGSAKDFHIPETNKTCGSHEALKIPSKMDVPNDLQMTGTGHPRLEALGAAVLPLEHVVESLDVSESVMTSSSLEVDTIDSSQTISAGEAHSVEVSMFDKEHNEGLSFLEEDARHEDFVLAGDNMFPEHVVRASRKGHLLFETKDFSTRTRAVVQYLKTAFEKSVSHQTGPKLNLDRMLRGRTRKEAARMFFEIL
ncbi:hypothetical protein KI387_006156, partial [Taxus chinensis]